MEQTVFVSKRSKNGANSTRRVFSWCPQDPESGSWGHKIDGSTLGHARQAAMAELSISQPSGPTQSSSFNPGGPLPPQEGDLAARNAERQKAEELMQQSEMAGAASVLAGLSAQALTVVGEWGADEIDVDLEEEAPEGGGNCNTFDLASSVLEELGEGGNGEDA